jgi:hypothetical protein
MVNLSFDAQLVWESTSHIQQNLIMRTKPTDDQIIYLLRQTKLVQVTTQNRFQRSIVREINFLKI